MADSFFTARNQVDPQIENAPVAFCTELIDASARRLVKLEGPFEVSKRLQRVADICAGAYVLPIEHWKALDKQDPAPQPQPTPPKPKRWERIWSLIVGNPGVVFWIAFFLGLWIGRATP